MMKLPNTREILLITGLVLMCLAQASAGCRAHSSKRSPPDTLQILQEVINYPALRDSLLESFKDQQMIILKSELIKNEYALKWNGERVKYEEPNAVNTSPDLNLPPKFVVTFPALKIQGGGTQVIFKFQNVGIIAKFGLEKGIDGVWRVVDFETWHI